MASAFAQVADVDLIVHFAAMRLSLSAFAMAITIILTTASCSFFYEIEVLRRGSHTVFKFEDAGLWGSEIPRVTRLSVAPVSRTADPIWEVRSIDVAGVTEEQIKYGVVPKGMTQAKAPVRLRIGEVYSIDLQTLDGGGTTQFVILPGSGPAQQVQSVSQ